MKMKKFLSIILSLTLLLTLGACGKKASSPDGQPTKDSAKVKTLRVGVSPDYPPYESYGDNGKLVGFDIDAFAEIEKILNENGGSYKIEWAPMDFSTIVSAVQSSQLDLGVSCFTYDPERDVIFSEPYLKSSQVIVVKKGSPIKSKDDLKGKKIGAGTGTTGEKAAKEIENAKVSSASDYITNFEILKNGGYDAVVCDEAVGKNYAAQDAFEMLSEKLVDESVSAITKKGNDDLMKEINAAIAKFVASPKYAELQEKHGLKS